MSIVEKELRVPAVNADGEEYEVVVRYLEDDEHSLVAQINGDDVTMGLDVLGSLKDCCYKIPT